MGSFLSNFSPKLYINMQPFQWFLERRYFAIAKVLNSSPGYTWGIVLKTICKLCTCRLILQLELFDQVIQHLIIGFFIFIFVFTFLVIEAKVSNMSILYGFPFSSFWVISFDFVSLNINCLFLQFYDHLCQFDIIFFLMLDTLDPSFLFYWIV